LVLESHRRKIQAKPKDYNKNSSRVSWDRNVLLAGRGQVTSRERRWV
jgi:hypothetical protein